MRDLKPIRHARHTRIMCRTADACGSAGVLSRTRRTKVCDSRLAPDGTEHEIDLNAEHHWALRDALARRQRAAINGVFLPRSGRLARGYRRALGSLAPWASLISGSPRATGLHVYALTTVLRTRYHAAYRALTPAWCCIHATDEAALTRTSTIDPCTFGQTSPTSVGSKVGLS